MTRIVIIGSSGRMGRQLASAALQDEEIRLVAAVERAGVPEIGQDVGRVAGMPEIGVRVTDDLESVIRLADTTVEFTLPDPSIEHLEVAWKNGKAAVIGTTGFTPTQLERLSAIARDIPVFFSPNMSLGVNLVFKILPMIARALADGYDIEIVEAHHHGKQDAPSGTALRMADLVAHARGTTIAERGVFGRRGIAPRQPGDIGVHAIRAGANAGEHSVMFASEGEQLEITHRAYGRQTYALGAMQAVKWIAGQAPGLYSMQDLLDNQSG